MWQSRVWTHLLKSHIKQHIQNLKFIIHAKLLNFYNHMFNLDTIINSREKKPFSKKIFLGNSLPPSYFERKLLTHWKKTIAWKVKLTLKFSQVKVQFLVLPFVTKPYKVYKTCFFSVKNSRYIFSDVEYGYSCGSYQTFGPLGRQKKIFSVWNLWEIFDFLEFLTVSPIRLWRLPI